MNLDDVCCLIVFVILVVIWIARQIARAKKEKEAKESVQPTYKPYEKTVYKRKEQIVRPDYRYKPSYQAPQTAYKPVYVQPKPEKTVCKRCGSDDLKFFDSGYVKCNKCGYYYYEGSRRVEHRR